MDKLQDRAFGKKDVYLLGKDADGIKYWLEAPSWDCGWYWGFGYVETYQNNRQPSTARDIDSHQHADGKYIAEQETDTRRRAYNSVDGDQNLFTGQFLVAKTYTKEEGWQLRELMMTFYQLRKEAELYGRGGMHQTTNPLKDLLIDEDRAKHINEKLIPAVTAKIIEILTPEAK